MKSHFESKEFFYSSVNGKTVKRENSVSIQNGKGTKRVVLTEDGKTKVSTHTLTPTEVKAICNREFIPGLFRPCLREANSQTRSLKARPSKSTTRRSPKKKGSKK